MKMTIMLLSFVFLTAGPWSVTQAAETEKSIPFLQPYPGSHQHNYLHRHYDEIRMPLGSFKVVGRNSGGEVLEATRSQPLEGEVFYAEYSTPKDRSALEVMRNYQQALERQGFEVLWQCKNNACIDEHDTGVVTDNNPIWPGAGYFKTYFGNGEGGRMLTARLQAQNGSQTWVYLWVSGQASNGDAEDTYMYAVQTKPMQMDLVQGSTEQLTAAEMGQALGQQGRFAMHLPFDFNQANLRPDAMAQVRQLAEVLRAHPDWRIGLDGHTDAVGSPAFNQKLSEDRAAAVKNALLSLGVPEAQVTTRGLGATQPVASNETEEGRAQNRRVEVVNLTPGFVPASNSGAMPASPSMAPDSSPSMTEPSEQGP